MPTAIRGPAIYEPQNQLFMGRLVDSDPISRNIGITGQLSPIIEERIRMSRGRYLAGFGEAATEVGSPEPGYPDAGVSALEEEDDVYGSGIFDASGVSTVHATMGVFGDHPSMPGYIQRHPPFTVNTEVADITSGAQVVEVPGGGMAYVERGGRNVGVPQPAYWPGKPEMDPAGPTSRYEPYVTLSPGGIGSPLYPDPTVAQAQVPVAPGPREVMVGRDVPWYPQQRTVPLPPTRPVPMRSIVSVASPSVSITHPPPVRHVPMQSIAHVATRSVPVPMGPGYRVAPASGFGSSMPPATFGSFLVAGAVVGAAAAVLLAVVGKKKR